MGSSKLSQGVEKAEQQKPGSKVLITKKEDMETALQKFHRLLQQKMDTMIMEAFVLLRVGLLRSEAKNFDKALEYLQKAALRWEIIMPILRSMLRQGWKCTNVLDLKLNNCCTFVNLAGVLLRHHHFEEARSKCTEALCLVDGQHVARQATCTAYFIRSLGNQYLGNYDEAHKDMVKAVKHLPEDVELKQQIVNERKVFMEELKHAVGMESKTKGKQKGVKRTSSVKDSAVECEGRASEPVNSKGGEFDEAPLALEKLTTHNAKPPGVVSSLGPVRSEEPQGSAQATGKQETFVSDGGRRSKQSKSKSKQVKPDSETEISGKMPGNSRRKSCSAGNGSGTIRKRDCGKLLVREEEERAVRDEELRLAKARAKQLEDEYERALEKRRLELEAERTREEAELIFSGIAATEGNEQVLNTQSKTTSSMQECALTQKTVVKDKRISYGIATAEEGKEDQKVDVERVSLEIGEIELYDSEKADVRGGPGSSTHVEILEEKNTYGMRKCTAKVAAEQVEKDEGEVREAKTSKVAGDIRGQRKKVSHTQQIDMQGHWSQQERAECFWSKKNVVKSRGPLDAPSAEAADGNRLIAQEYIRLLMCMHEAELAKQASCWQEMQALQQCGLDGGRGRLGGDAILGTSFGSPRQQLVTTGCPAVKHENSRLGRQPPRRENMSMLPGSVCGASSKYMRNSRDPLAGLQYSSEGLSQHPSAFPPQGAAPTPVHPFETSLGHLRYEYIAAGSFYCASSPSSQEFAYQTPAHAMPSFTYGMTFSFSNPQPQERRASAAEQLCWICHRGPRNTVALPCGHLSTCLYCLQKVEASNAPFCPICGSHINEVLPIYFE